jgi:hypothetical protein
MPALHQTPDSAYGWHPDWDDDLDFEGMSRGEYNHLKSIHDTPEANQARDEHVIHQDEESGYNWGPPPPIHDHEPPEPVEVDTHYDPDHGREGSRRHANDDPAYLAGESWKKYPMGVRDETDWDEAHHDWGHDKQRADVEHGIDQEEEHRLGAVLRQSEQWALARNRDLPHGPVHPHNDIQYLKDTGLYGEDEDHPYKGVIGRPSPHGNGYDVIRVVE